MQALVRLPEISQAGINACFKINPDASMACWIHNKSIAQKGDTA